MRYVTGIAIVLCVSTSALAQAPADEQSLVGTYRGHMHMDSGMMTEIGVDLVVERVENGRVTATLTQYNKRVEAGGACNGKFPMRGTFRDNKLTLGTRAGGDSGKCPFRFEAMKDGDKLVGTTARGVPIELAK